MASADEKTGLKIRRARRTDAARIAELSTELGYPATSQQIEARLLRLLPKSKHALFVAQARDPGLVGWIHVSVTNLVESDLRAEVNGLIVAETYRSLGAGAKLLEAAENWARACGCRAVNVRSNVIRDRAHKFYERQGYEHYKTQKAFRKLL
jgi:GNAT superfamily N-acetyltransferase